MQNSTFDFRATNTDCGVSVKLSEDVENEGLVIPQTKGII